MRFLPFVAALVAVACASPIPQSTPAIDSSSSTISPMSEKSDLSTTPLDRAWEETTTTPFAKDSRIEETSSISSSSVTPAAPVRSVRQVTESTTKMDDISTSEMPTTPSKAFNVDAEQSTTTAALGALEESSSSIATSSVGPLSRAVRSAIEALGWQVAESTSTAKTDDISTPALSTPIAKDSRIEETSSISSAAGLSTTPLDRAWEETTTTAFAKDSRIEETSSISSSVSPAAPVRRARQIAETSSTAISSSSELTTPLKDRALEETTTPLDRAWEETTTTPLDRAWEETTTFAKASRIEETSSISSSSVSPAAPVRMIRQVAESSTTPSSVRAVEETSATPFNNRALEESTTTLATSAAARLNEETTISSTPSTISSSPLARLDETTSSISSTTSVTPAAPVRRARQIAETSSTAISSSELTTPLKDRALEETTTPLDRAWEETTTFAKDSRIEETSSISSSSVSPAAPVRMVRGIEESHLGETTTAKMDDKSTTELSTTPLSERALEETTTFSDRAIEESTTTIATSAAARLNEESTSASTPSTTLSTLLSRRARSAVQGEEKLAESTTAKMDDMSTTPLDRAWEESTTTIATSTELRQEGEILSTDRLDDMSTTPFNDRAFEESTTPIASSTELRWEGQDSTIEAETTSAMNDISSTTFA